MPPSPSASMLAPTSAPARFFQDGSRHFVEYTQGSMAEAERLRQHREYSEANERARQQQEYRDGLVSQRVAEYVAAGPGAAGETAADVLAAHIDWLERSRRLATLAADRAAEVARAAERHAAAEQAIAKLDSEVGAATAAWMRFANKAAAPDDRGAERARYRTEVVRTAPLAALVDASSFECEVAKSVVTAIEAKLPDLRSAVLWASADGVVKRIQSLANDLAQQYAIINALSSVTGRRGAEGEVVQLPSVPAAEPIELNIATGADVLKAWETALAAVTSDPRAVITPPCHAPSKAPPAPTRPVIGRFFGRN